MYDERDAGVGSGGVEELRSEGVYDERDGRSRGVQERKRNKRFRKEFRIYNVDNEFVAFFALALAPVA